MVRIQVKQKGREFRHTLRQLSSDGRGWILFAVAFGWLLMLGTRLVFPAMLPQIKIAYGLGNTTAGAIISALGIMVATMQFPSGALADRFGERIVLVAGVLLSMVGLGFIAAFPFLPAFLFGVLLFGVGMGSYGSPRVIMLSNIYPDRDGTAIGLTFSAGHVGTTVLPFVAGTLTLLFGWQTGFLYLVPLFLLIGVGLWRVTPNHSGEDRKVRNKTNKTIAREVLSTVTEGQVLLAFGALSLWSFTFIGITTFLPTYLRSIKGIAPQTATTVYSLLFMMGLLAQAGAGNLSDNVGYRSVLVPLSAVSVIPLVLLPLTQGVVLLSGIVLLIGLRLGLMPVTNAYLIAAVPAENQGSSYGLVRSLQSYVGSTGAVFVGVLADNGLFDQAFFILAGLTVVMTVIYASLPTDFE